MMLLCCSVCMHCTVASELVYESGQDATLQCWGPRDAHVTLLEWSRPELISQGYVFFFQDQRSYENYQHESFKGRVQLRDSSMKDGDVAVILRNVRVSDTGTYECEITTSSIRNGERVVKEFKHSINLTVTDTGEFVEVELTAQPFIRSFFTPQRYDVGFFHAQSGRLCMVKAVPHEILTAGSNTGLIFLLLVCDAAV
uniref:Ig-like domain-containing protein n=1 Tax=Pundamilia nyererei TaxID=303518 RepID=A0A3B4GYF1_9CICH